MQANPLVEGFFDVFKIPTRRTVTQWADEKRILPSKGAAEPGKYRSSRTPYMREPMDCLSTSSPVNEVVLMQAAQTGKSESGNNWVGYVMEESPGPMLLVQPTVDNAKRYSKQRIAPMINDTPSLAKLVTENKSRDSSNTMQEKEFPGGILIMTGANSAAGLRSMPIRFLFADEISNWPADVDGEGDPLNLAEQRTNTFGRKRKILKTSTPGTKGLCRVEAEYLKTDQRKYYVPCPQCDHKHVLEWKNFVIPKDEHGNPVARRAHMVCPECGCVIEEYSKTDMLANGEWIATKPDNADGTKRGYQISALYSPLGWKSWARIAQEWLDAQGKPQLLQAFINNVLAETWEEEYSAKLDADGLAERAEFYDLLTVPEGGLVITAGIDVQRNRVEIIQRAWGVGEESWLVNYAQIYGDPYGAEVWQQLLNVINMPFKHASGATMYTYAAAVDSGDGDTTHEVYAFTRQHRNRHIIAIKGQSQSGKPALGKPTKQDINIRHQVIKKGAQVFPVGSDTIKSLIYGRLKRTETGAGTYHWPLGLPSDYWKQLTAEKKARKTVNGFEKSFWIKESGARNEVIDMEVYSYAALQYVFTRHNRATFWEQMRQQLEKTVPIPSFEAQEPVDIVPQIPNSGKISLSGSGRFG